MDDSHKAKQTEQSAREPICDAAILDAVARAIGRLRFGSLQLTIHDGKVVQLEITERRRFT